MSSKSEITPPTITSIGPNGETLTHPVPSDQIFTAIIDGVSTMIFLDGRKIFRDPMGQQEIPGKQFVIGKQGILNLG